MKGMIKLIGLTVITGAAGAAGMALWNNVLEGKTYKLVYKLKAKNSKRRIKRDINRSNIVEIRKTK